MIQSEKNTCNVLQDKEGSSYLNKFYARYEGKSAEESLDMLTKRVYAKPSRLTMLYRAVYPDHDEVRLSLILMRICPKLPGQ